MSQAITITTLSAAQIAAGLPAMQAQLEAAKASIQARLPDRYQRYTVHERATRALELLLVTISELASALTTADSTAPADQLTALREAYTYVGTVDIARLESDARYAGAYELAFSPFNSQLASEMAVIAAERAVVTAKANAVQAREKLLVKKGEKKYMAVLKPGQSGNLTTAGGEPATFEPGRYYEVYINDPRRVRLHNGDMIMPFVSAVAYEVFDIEELSLIPGAN
jgi:hypothetical protein